MKFTPGVSDQISRNRPTERHHIQIARRYTNYSRSNIAHGWDNKRNLILVGMYSSVVLCRSYMYQSVTRPKNDYKVGYTLTAENKFSTVIINKDLVWPIIIFHWWNWIILRNSLWGIPSTSINSHRVIIRPTTRMDCHNKWIHSTQWVKHSL